MNFMIIAARELKLGFRNPWAYSFLALFTFFSAAVLLIQSQTRIEGYTHTTGSLLNLILYLLPLMTILLGSFAVTSEKEEGGWQLLATYSLTSFQLLLGKYVGLAAVLFAIVGVSFGVSGLLGSLLGHSLSVYTLAFFYFSSLLLVFVFLGVSVWIGAWAKNRWQALTIGVGLWFVLILAWPTLLIALLGFLPYPVIKPALQILTAMNPAELIRVFMVTRIGGGTSFGPEYYEWIRWLNGASGLAAFVAIGLLWIAVSLGLATWLWERGRRRDG
ncbi:ABC transporter permease [Gorillibacterium sp. sgz5001074]|uniref:ABC transporter permease n=1 Tax=Gorillibacterium sp. sgz5001074 TaxID=3446695 RepID=UPI003F669B0A